ncbi:MAG: class A beta-lactamase-related serine hydrolase [Bryobacter sp.]|nr:class A beta-lactamase-related serine hydrolase [Bryobacter sp.]
MRRIATFLLSAMLLAVSLAAAGSAELEPDPLLAGRLAGVLHEQGLDSLISRKLVAVSLVDVTDPAHPRYAGVNDTVMMYAASLPKIAILLAAMESVRAGSLRYTSDVRDMLHNIARHSSNSDASKVVRLIGFDTIANTLTSERYRLYDPQLNGGLWVGKAYGGPSDYWRRDPLHNLSHGATSLQSARFFTLLAQGELAGPELCQELKAALARPGINHKFVKGLAHVPGAVIYRKSGTWRNWHSDAALVEFGGKRYVAVALTEDPNGGKILERLIGGLHEIICGRPLTAARR